MKIETIQDIERADKALIRLQRERDSFAINTATDLIRGNILEEMKRRMRQENYPENVVNDLILERVWLVGDIVKFRIFHEHLVDNGFDVAAGFEFGKKAFDTTGLHVFAGSQGTVFTQKTHHPAIPGTKIIETVMMDKLDLVREEFQKAQKRWQHNILNSS